MFIRKMMNYVGCSILTLALFFVLQSSVYSQTDTTSRTPGMGSGSGSSGMGSGSGMGTGSSGMNKMGQDTSGRSMSGFYSQADSLVQNLDSQVTLSDNQKSQIRQILMDLHDDMMSSTGKGTNNETGGETSGNTSMQSQDKQISTALNDIDDVLDQNQKQKFSSYRDTFKQEVRAKIVGSSSSNWNNGSGSGTGSGNNNSGSGTGNSGTGSGTGTDTTGTNRSGY